MNIENLSPEQALEAAKHNQKLAYLGKIGREREKFCIDYIEQKKKTYREALARRRSELRQQDEQITCVQGCTYCCCEFATADIRACEAIAYYVSRNDELLEKLLKSYAEWRQKLAPHSALVAEICRLQDKVVRGDPSVVEALEKHIIDYFNLGIACPLP